MPTLSPCLYLTIDKDFGSSDQGGSGPALKLANPLKLQRTLFVPPPRPAFDRAQDDPRSRGGGPPSRNSPARDGARPPRPSSSIGDNAPATGGDEEGKTNWKRSFQDHFLVETNTPNHQSLSGNKPAKRGAPVKVATKVYTKKDGGEDARNVRKNSLKLGTGKKGRGAGDTMRRGSLRKKDRSAEKVRRQDAAIEARTVQLPE